MPSKFTRDHKYLLAGVITISLLIAAFSIPTTREFIKDNFININWARVFIKSTPITISTQYNEAIAGADKLVIRAGGFNCCGDVSNNKVLLTVSDPQSLKDIKEHIVFRNHTIKHSYDESCMCCGYPGLDWYKGNHRIVLSSVQHGHAIRWKGFTSLRLFYLFKVFYGDAPLTEESAQWLNQWLKEHHCDKAVSSE
jgi:hypothetical protein